MIWLPTCASSDVLHIQGTCALGCSTLLLPESLDPASLKKIAHMEDSKKLNLLKFKWKPEENFKFPSRNSRRYNPRWECDFPWLRYSKSEDSVYCGYCLVFAKSGCFSTSGYIDWKNAVGDKRGNFKKHEQCKQHQDAQQQATEFLRVCDSKERKDVYSFLSTAYKEKLREIVKYCFLLLMSS